jgi:BlaI family penicillinase repressor
MDLKLISDSEWEIMRIVWAKAPVTSTVIIGDLEVTKGWMPTTVKTFLSRLVKKDMLQFEKIGRSFYYTSLVSEEKCVRDEIQSVIEKVYGGIIYEETEHFILKGNPDIDYIKGIASALENSYSRISTDLEACIDQPIQVYVHTTQRGLHSALGLLDGPKWLRAGHIWGLLHVSPKECFDDISANHVAVHTFLLLLIQKINPTVPYWLQQAVATYYAGWMTQEKIDGLNLDLQDFPALTKQHGMLSSYISFKEVHGYEWGYTVIDFIVKNYAIKQLAAFLRSPYDYVGVFGVTEEQFWEGWQSNLRAKSGEITEG